MTDWTAWIVPALRLDGADGEFLVDDALGGESDGGGDGDRGDQPVAADGPQLVAEGGRLLALAGLEHLGDDHAGGAAQADGVGAGAEAELGDALEIEVGVAGDRVGVEPDDAQRASDGRGAEREHGLGFGDGDEFGIDGAGAVLEHLVEPGGEVLLDDLPDRPAGGHDLRKHPKVGNHVSPWRSG